MCGNKSTTTSSSPAPQAMSAYTGLLNQAANVASTPYQPYTGEGVAPVNQQEYSGIGGINEYAYSALPTIGSAEQMASSASSPITQQQISQYENPYTQQVVGATQAEFNNQNAQQAEQLTGNAVAAGAFGGNRTSVAQGELANQQQMAQAPVIAGLESSGYTQGVNTALTEQQAAQSGAYELGSLGTSYGNAALTGANAQMGAGELEQQTQQAQDTFNYQQYLNQMAYPFETTSYQAGIDTGVGSLMGGTSETTQPYNVLSSLGGLGMLALGLGGSGGLLNSDRRMKENLHKIGKLFDGQTIYRFNYKGDKTVRIGLVAQDVEKVHPDAVHDIGGFKRVDYDEATRDAIRRARGGVAPIYFARGGVAPFMLSDGGIVPRFAAGGMPYGGTTPYSGANSYVPSMQLTHGSGPPKPPNPSNQQSNANQAQSIGQLTKLLSGSGNTAAADAAQDAADDAGEGASDAAYGMDGGVSADAIYRRGGAVRGYDSGGSTDIMLPAGVNPDLTGAEPDFYGEFAMESGRLPGQYADGGGDDTPVGGELGELLGPSDSAPIVVPSGDAGWGGPPPTPDTTSPPPVAAPTPDSAAVGPPQGIEPSPGPNGAAIAPEDVPLPQARPADLGEARSPIQDQFDAVEKKYGLPSGYLNYTAKTESGYNPRAYNELSGAKGMFQFINSTGRQYGLVGNGVDNRNDWRASTDAAGRLAADNQQTLRQALGRDPTAGELYLAHQQGAAGAVRLLTNPNARAGSLVGDRAISANGGNPNWRAGQFVNYWDNRFNRQSTGARVLGPGDQAWSGAPGTSGVSPTDRAGGVSPSIGPEVGAGSGFGAGVAPDTTATTRGGYQPTGVAPRSGIDLSANSKLWPALISAGAGMMASRSPYFGQALGEGALAGMRQYGTEQQQELSNRKVDLEAQRLSDEMKYHQKELDLRTKPFQEMTPYQKAEIELRRKSEESLSEWRNRTNLVSSGREIAGGDNEGHPIVYDKSHPGVAFDGITGAAVDRNVQTRPVTKSSTPGAVEHLADSLVEESQQRHAVDPSVQVLTKEQAVELAHKAPNEQREKLAQNAWNSILKDGTAPKNDPKRTIEYWRQFYGVEGQQQPMAPAAPQPARSAQAQPQRKYYQGKWYIRGPNGESVLDQNQNP